MSEQVYQIAVLKGDGIGPEVVDQGVKVLQALQERGGPKLEFAEYASGANCYLDQGDPLPEDTLTGCRSADAVLLGAMVLPEV